MSLSRTLRTLTLLTLLLTAWTPARGEPYGGAIAGTDRTASRSPERVPPGEQLATWVHTSQADWMAGDREHLDVRTLDALGSPTGFDHDPAGAIRLRSQPGTWRRHPDSPVMEPSAEGTWDDAVISEAKIVFDGRSFHMWYAGRQRGPPGLKTPMDVGYATSADGIQWTKHNANPVLVRGRLGSYDENMITAPYVLYDGKLFHMWFSAADFSGNWSINYATSPDGANWHKVAENPLMEESHDDRWDAVYIAEPAVIFSGSSFQMWYNGASATTETLLGTATSPDGIHWSRAEENRPVLNTGPDGAWDDFAIAQAHVLYDGEQYKMWYEGHSGESWRIGYATSSDGMRWERDAGNPIVDLGPEGAWDSKTVSEPYVLFDGQTYWLWHSGYDGRDYSIGLATAPVIYTERGVFVSPTVENPRRVEWGTLTCTLDLPEGTGVSLEVATSDDGAAWREWQLAASALVSGVNRVDVTRLGLPASRTLRYRVTLTTSDPAVSPLIREVALGEAAPDFGITLAQDAVTVQAGQRAKATLALEPARGFDAPVSLRVDGLPPQVSAVWEPRSVTPPGSATVVLGVGPMARPGTVPLTITATSGELVHALALSLSVIEPPPTATPVPTAVPTPTPTPLPPPVALPPVDPRPFWTGVGIAAGSVTVIVVWVVLLILLRPRRSPAEQEESPRRPVWRHPAWAVPLILLALWGVYRSWQYVETRQQAWEAYQSRVRPGVRVADAEDRPVPTQQPDPSGKTGQIYVAGIDASGMTADEVRQAVEARVIAPYRRTITVHYLDQTTTLNTEDLDLETNLEEILSQAVAVGSDQEPQERFGAFLLHNPEPYDIHLPLTHTFNYDLLTPWVEELALEVESPPVEHDFDAETLVFTRGETGIRLDTGEASLRLREAVDDLEISEIELPYVYTPPDDWELEDLQLTISHAASRWNEPALPATSEQITLSFEYDRWIGPTTPAADWAPTQTMTGYVYLPGRMGWTLDVLEAQRVLQEALDEELPLADVGVFTDTVPVPLTLADIQPQLLEIAGHFSGLTGLYVQDLTTGQEIRHNTYVTTSGMSMIKVAIMVTAYRSMPRPFSEALQDAMAQMIAHSINEKSNEVILQIGEGDLNKGLAAVNGTLQALGMYQTYIRSGYRTESGSSHPPIPVPERPGVTVPPEEQLDLWPDTAMQTSLSDQALLFEALYWGAQGTGRLPEAYPELSAEDCQEMLDLLKTNPTRTLLGPGFSDDVPMAHKNGFGGGSYTDERMDVGIVWPPDGRPYLVGLYQWDKMDWIHWLRVWPQQIELSTTLYNYLTMPPPLPAQSGPE